MPLHLTPNRRRRAVGGPATRPAASTPTTTGSHATPTGDDPSIRSPSGPQAPGRLEDIEMSPNMRIMVTTVLGTMVLVASTQLRKKDWCAKLCLFPLNQEYHANDDFYSCSACAIADEPYAEHYTGASRSPLNATFWPSLEHRLTDDDSFADRNWSHIGLECLVCHGPLLFEGQYDELGNPKELDALVRHCARRHPADEVAVVLPCGHIIGHRCLTTLRDMRATPSCPMCRFPGQYAHCECPYEDLPAPRDAEELHDFPLIATTGFVVPEDCDNCHWTLRRDCWCMFMRALLLAMVPSLGPFVPVLSRSALTARECLDFCAIAESRTEGASENENIERLLKQLVLMFQVLEPLRRSGHIKRSWAAPRALRNSPVGRAELIDGELICGVMLGRQ